VNTNDAKSGSSNKSALALNKGHYLNESYKGEHAGKDTDNASPFQHSSGKIIFSLLAIIVAFSGSMIGVWSIVFWDWLGGWRWMVSAAGWLLMMASTLALFHENAVLAAFDSRSENVVVKAVIIAELELGDIEMKVSFAKSSPGTSPSG